MLRQSCSVLWGVVLVLSFWSTVDAGEPVINASPDNYHDKLTKLDAGDRLRLEAGIYRDGLSLRGVSGDPGAPVVIEGPSEGPAAVFRAREGANTVSLVNVSHVVIRNLTLDGDGRRVAAVRGEATAEFNHHVTLEGLTIRGHDAGRGIVGISSFAPAWGWVIRNNHIRGAGTGMYLGDSDGGDPFIGGVIENNVVEETIGYNIQIKHQNPRGLVPGMPTEPQQTVIRNNVLSKASGGAQGTGARPNLLLGHWPLEGPGADDRYLVYGNFFYRNPTEALMQAEGNVSVYNNVFFNPDGPALRLLDHNDVPRRIGVYQNTIVASGVGVRMVEAHPGHEQRVEGNAIFAANPLDIGEGQPGARIAENVTDSFAEARRYLREPAPEQGMPDLAPAEDVILTIDGRDSPWADGLPTGECGFEGRIRTRAITGAYATSGAPQWSLQVAHKPEEVSPRDWCR